MASSCQVFVLTIIIVSSQITSSSSSSFSPTHGLTRGSSLTVENKDDLLVSPNGIFMAGFHQVGENAYVFAVWISEQVTSTSRTVVWMANRDALVNGKDSKLSLWDDGNLVLIDAGQYVIWSTQTESKSSLVHLRLENTGNLVLYGGEQTLWRSFDYPTDTLLPNQPFTKNTQLVSSRSSSNCSSGYYKLFFDNESILRLLYNGPETTSIYWPDPRLVTWRSGRFQYIDRRRAMLDSYGQFNSSDGLSFVSADFGTEAQRIMKIDTDGNVRVYSLVKQETGMKWEVQWQALSQPCRIDGTCGPNSLCTYSKHSGSKCSCLIGHKMVNSKDWSSGCEAEFKTSSKDASDFIVLRQAEFYGHDNGLFLNTTFDTCKRTCLQNSNCRGFSFSWRDDKGYFCFMKNSLHNGYQLGIEPFALIYIKLPKRLVSEYNQGSITEPSFVCPRPVLMPETRSYAKRHDTKPLGFLLLFGCTIGFIEIICIVFFWYCSSKRSSTTEQSYFPAATAFRRYTYRELKKATCNFSEEIGRGGASIVYKGRLADDRIAAIKRLSNSNYDQGEAEFQAEISTIGRVNHQNLIETWGYCAEGKHRLVVYEYMENGSLDANLSKLDWAKRFDIAIGTAKGLAYLHEECLEWILHCDVKPQNILLDGDYNPKVADFGLSKLSDRGGASGTNQCNFNFSMMRGTRGYMAPEWVYNLPITSKVDVYSYGVVILEMITGRRNPSSEPALIDWVRDRVQTVESWVEHIMDPSIKDEYDEAKMENLVTIALQCIEEDREARPSMSQVVHMLLHCD